MSHTIPAKGQPSMKALACRQILRGFASEIGYEERTMRNIWGKTISSASLPIEYPAFQA